MGKIFISYRRDDTSDFAKRLHNRLRLYYREEDIFLDVDDIPYAAQFPVELDRALKQTDIVLILIGPKWLAQGHSGNPRIQDAQDYVRLEIERAIQAGKAVFPILIGPDAQLPSLSSLPESIAVFPQLQTLKATEALPAHEMNTILKTIYRYSTAPRRDYDPERAKRLPPFLRYKPDTRLGLFVYYGAIPSLISSLLLGCANALFSPNYNFLEPIFLYFNIALALLFFISAMIFGVIAINRRNTNIGAGIILT